MQKIQKQKEFEAINLPRKGEEIIIELLFNSVLSDRNNKENKPSQKKLR
ncbi:MAG: hypothetical protein KAR40_17275 [Candidatus Sabulitectum sp.]|nr:hypothetical protein [Candidatus Sabulitectum sp.]